MEGRDQAATAAARRRTRRHRGIASLGAVLALSAIVALSSVARTHAEGTTSPLETVRQAHSGLTEASRLLEEAKTQSGDTRKATLLEALRAAERAETPLLDDRDGGAAIAELASQGAAIQGGIVKALAWADPKLPQMDTRPQSATAEPGSLTLPDGRALTKPDEGAAARSAPWDPPSPAGAVCDPAPRACGE